MQSGLLQQRQPRAQVVIAVVIACYVRRAVRIDQIHLALRPIPGDGQRRPEPLETCPGIDDWIIGRPLAHTCGAGGARIFWTLQYWARTVVVMVWAIVSG